MIEKIPIRQDKYGYVVNDSYLAGFQTEIVIKLNEIIDQLNTLTPAPRTIFSSLKDDAMVNPSNHGTMPKGWS